MPEDATRSVTQAQQERKIERCTAARRIAVFSVMGTAVAALAAFVVSLRAGDAGLILAGLAERNRVLGLQRIRGWKPKKDAEAQFPVDVPDVFKQAFVMEKDSKRFPKTGGWGYAVFNYDAASGQFTPDAASLSDCGNACHTAVKAKDYIFHPYEKR